MMTTKLNPEKPKTKNASWDSRTRFVVYGQAFLFLVAWAAALGPRISERFWNAKSNEENYRAIVTNEETPKSMVHFIKTFVLTYYTKRYIWFLPHIIGAIFWWNLYFLQLIPSIRQKYRRFHRILGRFLMVCALAQTISGVGLAYMGTSSTFKIISYTLAVSIVYCVYNAWYFAAIEKDIPKHKYWAMRLVGYTQAIAFQRVFMLLLIISHRTGWMGLYPAYDEDDGQTMEQVFDDSFALSLPTAMMITEWYLASYYGWTESSRGTNKGNQAAIESEQKAGKGQYGSIN